jgi:hypothetical protein
LGGVPQLGEIMIMMVISIFYLLDILVRYEYLKYIKNNGNESFTDINAGLTGVAGPAAWGDTILMVIWMFFYPVPVMMDHRFEYQESIKK